MGELTSFGFYKPAEGEDGWATQVNNNADLLEDAFNANKTIPAIVTDDAVIGESNEVIFASETISALQSINSALNEASGVPNTHVKIVGRGEQTTSGFAGGDFSDVTITTEPGTIWKLEQGGDVLFEPNTATGFTFDGVADVNSENRAFSLPQDDDMTIKGTIKGSSFAAILLGANSATTVENFEFNGTIDGEGQSGYGIWLNCPTNRATIKGSVRQSINNAVYSDDTRADNGPHSELTADLKIRGGLGFDTGKVTLDRPDIEIQGFTVADAAVRCSPYDGDVEAVASVQDYGLHIIDGRDSLIRGSVEDGSEHGVHIDLQTSSKHADTGSAKHTIDVSATNFDKAGCLLSGGSFCRVEGQYNQNSSVGADTWSGVQLEDGPTASEPSVNNVISVTATDTQTTKTQKYGVEETENSDYNLIDGCHVSGNSTGGILTTGANSLEGDNMTSGA